MTERHSCWGRLAGRALLLLCLLAVPSASAQVPCEAPRSPDDPLRQLNEEFTKKITEPLMRHNAGGLGPVLWAYIAGQARAESLGGLKGPDGKSHTHSSYNLWNVQTNATAKCRHDTIDACLAHNLGKPLASSKATAAQPHSPCWLEDGKKMQIVWVCFPSYPSLEASADAYLKFKPVYTGNLKKLAVAGNPPINSFLDVLASSAWSSRAGTASYRTETENNIQEVLRGIVESRETAEKELAQARQDIATWCAAPDVGDAKEREALKQRQDELLARIALFDSVCARSGGGTDQAPPPAGDNSINDCRQKPSSDNPPSDGPPTDSPPSDSPPSDTPPADQPPAGNPPSDKPPGDKPPPTGTPTTGDRIVDKAPQSSAGGVGEPHYITPGGTLFSTQHAGEFWLLRSGRDAQVQVRQTPWQNSESAAIISAVAISAGRHRVGVYAEDNAIRVDGHALSWSGEFLQQDLGDGHVLGIWGPTAQPEVVAVMWADGSTLRMVRRGSWIDVTYQVMRGVDMSRDSGLIGRPAPDPANDFITRDGDVLSKPTGEQIAAFVETWRIADGESLFDYPPGKSAADYNRTDFPKRPAALAPEALAQARETCRKAGIEASARVEACAFDLAVTGDQAFLQSHLLASQALRQETSWTTAPPKTQQPPAQQMEYFEARFRPDIAQATPLENGRTHSLSISPGQQRTFRIEITRPDVGELFVHSRRLSCIGTAYDGTVPGYQLFDQQGRALSKALATCSDLYGGPIRPGTYYLVVVGANSGGEAEAAFEAFHY